MTTLRVILDEMLDTPPRGAARNAEELTRGLIASAPSGCVVEGIVSASTEPEYDLISERLPGLKGLYKNSLARRELTLAWSRGFTRLPGRGMIHAPSLFAPLARHDRLNNPGQQTVVTISDAFAWTSPDSVGHRTASWTISMAKRAHRHADAVVVPTHATADRLSEFMDFGDRIRIIGGAPSARIALAIDEQERAQRLELPDRYLLAFGGLESRRGLVHLLTAIASLPAVPLVVVGPALPEELAAATAAAGLDAGRVVGLTSLSDSDLAVVIARATALIIPSIEDAFSLPMLEAFKLGTPVIHSDDPALVEIAGDSGLSVPLAGDFTGELTDAIRSVLDDDSVAERLTINGTDRARVFSWRGSAEKVWQLHADL